MKSRKRAKNTAKGLANNNSSKISDSRRLRQILFAAKNLRLGVSKVRQELTLEEISEFVSEYARYPAIRSALVMNPFPSSISKFDQGLVLRRLPFESEVAWHASCLGLYGDKLAKFHNMEVGLYKRIMNSDHHGAEEILDALELEFGQSLWLIAQRILLYSNISDTSRLTDYVGSVVLGSERGVPGLVAWFYAQKVDPEISISKYLQYANEYVKAVADDSSYTSYLRWVVDKEHSFDAENLFGILTYSETASLIDRYVALRDVIGRAISVGAAVSKIPAQRAHALALLVGDEELVNTTSKIMAEQIKADDINEKDLEIFDLYSTGKYEEAFYICKDLIERDPLKFHLFEIFARCAGRSGLSIEVDGDPLWARIIRDLSTAFLRGESYNQALQRVRIACHVSPTPRLIWSLGSFLARELTPDDVRAAQTLDAQAAAATRTGSPWHLSALDRALPGVGMLEEAGRFFPKSAAITLQLSLARRSAETLAAAAELGVPSGRIAIYEGHCFRRVGNFDAAVASYSEVLTASFTPDRLAAAKGTAICLRAQKRFIEAADLVSKECLGTPSAYRLFALPNFISEIEADGLPGAYSTISLPILYNIYSQYHSPDRDLRKADAAEEYVFSQGSRLPSGLQAPALGEDRDKYIYFLKEVCAPRVLDPFMDLDTTSAVELERIAICQKLTEADPEEIEVYGDEIREITRRRVVRERLKQVEKSKIFVDVPNIRKSAEKNIREKFVRFQESISRPDYNHAFMGMINTIREIVGKDMNVVHFPDHPPDDREQAFRKLCVELMNLLLTSQEYGFKTYLSTRIKHGTLAAQLSSPFSLNNILLEENEGFYARDEYWDEQLSLNADQSISLSNAIEKFSRDIEGTIDELKDQKIQLKSEDHPDAWLDFSVFRNETLFLQAQIDGDTTFDQFFDLVLARFWSALDQNLSIVRARLAEETRPRIAQHLDQLQQAVARALPGVWAAPLHSAIAAARTEFQNSMNVVIEWFKLTQAAERPDYEFSIAVDVAAESINNCFKSRPINVIREIEVNRDLKGETLESMVDILFILFENAVTHAHAMGGSAVNLRAAGSENVLLLEVENAVPPQQNIQAQNIALSERLSRVASASSQAMVSKEGGSGFPKIVKILKHDLSGTSTIRARFTDRGTFRTDIEFESYRVFV